MDSTKVFRAGKIKLSSNLRRFALKQVFANREAFLGLVIDGDTGDQCENITAWSRPQHKELKTGKNSWINSVLNIKHPRAPL